MSSTHWRVLLGSLIALSLGLLVVRLRYRLDEADVEVRTRITLQEVAQLLSGELEQGSSTPEGRGWHAWRLVSGGYRPVDEQTPPIDLSTLRHALAMRVPHEGSTVLVGPLATATGGDALVLATPTADRTGMPEWRGAWRSLDELMSAVGAGDLVKQGERLQLYDSTQAVPLYESDEGLLSAPVIVPLRFRDSVLELRAAPRSGWATSSRMFAPSLLVLLAVLLWSGWEWGNLRALRLARDELAESAARRQVLTGLYGKALENVAALESRLQLVSSYDAATGLANRRSLLRSIETLLEGMRQTQYTCLCVLTVGFEQGVHVVGSFGAEYAARVLALAAERVARALPAQDALYRIGDFNLAAALPDVAPERAEALANAIVTAVQAPITLDSHTFLLRPRLGLTQTSSAYESASRLLDHANTALGAVPEEGPVRYCWFESAAARTSAVRLQLEADLNRAFEENQLFLEFEPFVLPVAGSVVGYEALIRWNHPTEGRLPPSRFVPIALQAGMGNRLNAWVMREATRQAATWRRAGYRDLFINFNLSAEAFREPRLVEDFAALLAQYEVPGRQLVIELTESTLIQDLAGAIGVLKDLSDLGVGAWLDDFGTGYSSLSHLRVLPLKGVKIDRSFIEQVDIDSRAFGFLKALIDLISYLGMQSIAEGIETVAQYELLSLTTCDLYQGHHFARSMSAAEAERWMQGRLAGAQDSASNHPLEAAPLRRLSG